ncbi:MAG: lasso peptide biosynthesis B2 protein [Gemmatimonadales bacterium]
MPGLGRLASLSARAWTDFARAHAAVIYATLAVRFRSRGRLLASETDLTVTPLPPAVWKRVSELEQALARALKYGLLRPACLPRSVALHWLLTHSGVPGSRIRIGVRPGPEGLAAHAWVTLAGEVVGDDPVFVARYTEIADTRVPGLT